MWLRNFAPPCQGAHFGAALRRMAVLVSIFVAAAGFKLMLINRKGTARPLSSDSFFRVFNS